MFTTIHFIIEAIFPDGTVNEFLCSNIYHHDRVDKMSPDNAMAQLMKYDEKFFQKLDETPIGLPKDATQKVLSFELMYGDGRSRSLWDFALMKRDYSDAPNQVFDIVKYIYTESQTTPAPNVIPFPHKTKAPPMLAAPVPLVDYRVCFWLV